MKPIAVLMMMLMMLSCRRGGIWQDTPVTVSNAGKDASCPFITKDADGNTVVSWVEKNGRDGNGMMYYAVSNDNGHTFSKPAAIPATAGVFPHDENLPKLLFKPGGGVIALFGVEANDPRNEYAGKVMYAQSFDNGRSWEAAVPMVKDTAGYDQRYFDMGLLPGGEAAAIWLDNREAVNAEGSTLYFAVTAGRNGFRDAKPVAATVCPCCRTKMYVSANGDIHLAYRDIINDSIRDMVHQLSADGGKTFSAPVRISADNWVVNGCPHTGPSLTANSKGLHFSWFTMGGGQGAFYCRSADNGNTYTQKESLGKSPMAKHPQMTTVNDQIMIVWDEPVKWKDGFNYRIGFQYKDAEGETKQAGLLTADSSYATYPVISALKDNSALVAYKKTGVKGGEVVVDVLHLQ